MEFHDDTLVPSIWWSGDAHEWWMEPDDPRLTLHWLTTHPDAIRVTNAYDVLSAELIERLQRLRQSVTRIQ